MLLTKTTAAQNEIALNYHSVRGLYFLAVVFLTTIFLEGATQPASCKAGTFMPDEGNADPFCRPCPGGETFSY